MQNFEKVHQLIIPDTDINQDARASPGLEDRDDETIRVRLYAVSGVCEHQANRRPTAQCPKSSRPGPAHRDAGGAGLKPPPASSNGPLQGHPILPKEKVYNLVFNKSRIRVVFLSTLFLQPKE